MNKISTKYFNQIFRYINTFEEENKHPAFGSQFETVIEAIESLPRQERINFLDLGCGLGNVLFTAKQILGNKHKYVGIDNNQSYLDVAKAVDGQFQLINTDLLSKNTQRLIGNADVVYCYLPLPVYQDMQALYAVISHYMKPGTTLICNDSTLPTFNSFTRVSNFTGLECCSQTDIQIFIKKPIKLSLQV
jgi:ubiquinone/menaquinone biosynthesis C-methylase UbiE